MTEQDNQDQIGEVMIEKMKTHEKEKGTTNWMTYATTYKIDVKVMAAIVLQLEKMDVIHSIKHPSVNSIALTAYGWNFPGYKAHRENQRKIERRQRRLIRSSIANNWLSPLFAGLAFIATIGSVLIAWWDYQKPNPEELKPTIQEINTTLQQQAIELNNLQQNARNIQTRLQSIADSVGKK